MICSLDTASGCNCRGGLRCRQNKNAGGKRQPQTACVSCLNWSCCLNGGSLTCPAGNGSASMTRLLLFCRPPAWLHAAAPPVKWRQFAKTGPFCQEDSDGIFRARARLLSNRVVLQRACWPPVKCRTVKNVSGEFTVARPVKPETTARRIKQMKTSRRRCDNRRELPLPAVFRFHGVAALSRKVSLMLLSCCATRCGKNPVRVFASDSF